MTYPPLVVDLYSDTKTRPSPAMRRAMAEAEVGDEQAFEDPTVTRLCAAVAELLGKEDAVFLPSGTMANQIAYRLHCRPGEEIILDRTGHAIDAEAGGAAALAGAMLRPLDGPRGIFTAEQVRAAIRPDLRHCPRSRLVSIENTSNFGGGSVWPLATIEAIDGVAKGHGLAMHLDGARLMNAVVASGTSARDYCASVDSCWIDFSKGLGAPVGAALAGSTEFVHEAWRLKQQMGGAMRQAGIIAAGALYALEHNVERLAEDHANARFLAEGLARIPGVKLVYDTIPTNILFFDVSGTGMTPQEVEHGINTLGVRMGGGYDGAKVIRAVTHLDVTRDDCAVAIDAVRQVCAGR
ncbi:MAG TPA: threonine aldolase family protein, partial [Geminicoccaceae bacterium]|nr:threonine aldolase family protein [Geminicoccaceae bacterium]